MIIKNLLLLSIILVSLVSCKEHKDTLFTLLDNDDLGVDFSNDLNDTEGTNIFSYRNYYNGGGVAVGDVNNDGLNDIYLTSNQGDNQLLVNKGNWKFENVAESAGVKGLKYWSTGVTMADVNADGWLDIYVCNSGNAQGNETENELFINQKDGTFKELGREYGLADRGLSTHAVFFDYDLDGDLDCYVLNNSFKPIGSFDFTRNLRTEVDEAGGDRLMRNDNGHFNDVTLQAGIYSSDIGFGLGVSSADINDDGYPDLFVSNDFFEHDYLYINQRDGTFKEEVRQATGHLSLASMGSDIADINNDGHLDIFTTEMLPERDDRLKLITSFESHDIVRLKQKDGYFNQYMQNCLQLNNGDGTFSEIAFYSGVAATDWSWGALSFDMNNDGWNDLFVSNGIYKDLTNQDYIEYLGRAENVKLIMEGKKFNYSDFASEMNSTPIANCAFINNRDLTFTDKAEELGLGELSFSNGAAYGDLDNDGDNDLVVNNVNMPVFIYRNNAERLSHNYLQIRLKGDKPNPFAIGATVRAYVGGMPVTYHHQPARGFQSCISPNLITIGLGKATLVDSLTITWPDRRYQVIKKLATNAVYSYSYTSGLATLPARRSSAPQLFKETTAQLFDSVPAHQEDRFIDFDKERLMLQMLSAENPYLAPGDVNGDGLTDFFLGSSKGSPAAIYIQQKSGKFLRNVPDEFRKQSYLETAGAVFGDFDRDGDEDLIISFGGNQEEAGSDAYIPRYFENDGKGNLKRVFEKNLKVVVNASVVVKADYDNDGDFDLFVGGRSTPGLYGSSPASYVLENDGKGNFKDISKRVLGSGNRLGMVTSAEWADLDKNGFPDLICAGNWMGIKIFRNQNGKFTEDTQLNNYKGWWSSICVDDINGDGYPDILGGNLGLNSKFKASAAQPMKLFIGDFDDNGVRESIASIYRNDSRPYVYHMRPDLVAQMPSLKKRFLRYEEYAGKTFDQVFSADMLSGAEVREINHLATSLFIADGKGKFSCVDLPFQAQLSSVNTILCDDLDRDGTKEIILAGNDFGFKPELGRLDASYGHVYRFQDNRFRYIPSLESGISLTGQVRSSAMIKNGNGARYYLFGRNNDKLVAYSLN